MHARYSIVDLDASLVDATAALLHDSFRGRSESWQDLPTARIEVLESLEDGHISRVAVDDRQSVIGWIGATSMYSGHSWELHPLVVTKEWRRRGVGRALVRDLEAIVSSKGATTLWLGSDDEHGETTLSGVDLYDDIPGALRTMRNLKEHPYEFYVRVGFKVVGVLPDANGIGKPDIFFAKRVTS